MEVKRRTGIGLMLAAGVLLVSACGGGAATSPEAQMLIGARSDALTAILSPSPGTTLGDTATFTWSNTGAAQYALWIGSTQGGWDISSKILSGTSLTVNGLPSDGRTLYVRVWDNLGTWAYNDYTYTAQATTLPALTSPTTGSTFAGDSVAFTWSAGSPAATDYALWVGSTPGGYDLWANSSLGVVTTATASPLPIDGRSVYVRLWYKYGTSWYHGPDTQYTASGAAFTITSPTPSSTLTASSQAFTFTSGATDYALWVGTSSGAFDIWATSSTGGTASATATNLPIDGSTLYVRFWYQTGSAGTWYHHDYTYTAWTAASPAISTPAPGSTLTAATQAFTWNAGADEYALWVGSTAGGYDIWATSSVGTATTATATGLPVDGSTLYVRFWYRFGTSWYHTDYTYNACNSTTGTCGP